MSAPFIGVFTALYDYQAQNDEELSINENDILYLLQKSDFDDWWLVKKRIVDANAEEPQGLVPKTYIQPATPISTAIALYDYTKQTEEELSFNEGTTFNVYDTADPNWTLVNINNQQFGFVPGNYIEIQNSSNPVSASIPTSASTAATAPTAPHVMGLTPFPEPSVSPARSTPAAQSFPPPPQRIDRTNNRSTNENMENSDEGFDAAAEDDGPVPPMPARPTNKNKNKSSSTKPRSSQRRDDYSDDAYSDDEPAADGGKKSFFSSSSNSKNRSRSNTANSAKLSRRKSISNLLGSHKDDDEAQPIHGDFAWNIHEIEGKKKRSGILEIGNGKVYLDIDNRLSESWPVSNLINYNLEKKHVFLDFKSPSYSFELHVANKSSAQAIISILGDMKGLQSQSALADVKRAQREGEEAASSTSSSSSSKKKGIILYDFDGAADDELSCNEGDTVYIINDKKSKEWWMVENSRGRRGVVPANYVKLVSNKSKNSNGGNKDAANSGGFLKNLLGPNGKSPKKKNARDRDRDERELRERARLEHERGELEKQRRRMEQKEKELEMRDREQRERREKIRHADEKLRERRMREASKSANSASTGGSSEKDSNKPNPHRVRTWIDRSGAFKVEAEFLGVQQGKIHLHKLNGVKIAVAANKLSSEDLEYVERLTGTSLDKYKPQLSKTEPTINTEMPSSSGATSAAAPATPSLPSRESSSAVARQRASSVPLRADLVDYWFNFCVEAGVDVAVCDRYARNFAQEQVDNTVLDGVTPALMRTLGVREGDILKIKKKIDTTLGRNTTPTPEPVLGKNPKDPLPTTPTTSGMSDDEWATKPAAKSTVDASTLNKPNNTPAPAKSLTPQITGSIQDLLDVKPMEPTRTGITPVKPVNTIGLSSSSTTSTNPEGSNNTASTLGLQKTGTMAPALTGGLPLMAMPTGFMPITMVPMMTGMTTGMQPLRTGALTTGLTGGISTLNPAITGGMPTTTFGVNSLAQQPQQPQQQKTGGAFIMPLTTGGMPVTSFGANPTGQVQPTGGLFKLQPTGVTLQKTGGFATTGNTIPAMQPTMKTGGGFVPQSNFGLQLNNAMTGGAGMNMMNMNPAITGGMGGMPATSFGGMNPAITGGMPTTSFGGVNSMMNPAITGGMPTTSFGGVNPMMNPAMMNPTMMNPAMMNPAMTGNIGGMPNTSFGGNAMMNSAMTGGFGGNMMNPAMTGGIPPSTSFGGPGVATAANTASFNNNAALQSQPTGMGFGNSIVPEATGKQANLANATADNPFGF